MNGASVLCPMAGAQALADQGYGSSIAPANRAAVDAARKRKPPSAPPKDGQAARTKTSSGSFEFQRPGRFKFVYKKPFEQTIVADGQTLWLHDVDLNQVTARGQKEVLGSTPAALIAAGTDLKGLSDAFDLKPGAAKDGLEWLEAKPKDRNGQLQMVRVGFKQGQLSVLDIEDSLGQRSVLTFSNWQSNAPLKAVDFKFEPPAGASVMRP